LREESLIIKKYRAKERQARNHFSSNFYDSKI